MEQRSEGAELRAGATDRQAAMALLAGIALPVALVLSSVALDGADRALAAVGAGAVLGGLATFAGTGGLARALGPPLIAAIGVAALGAGLATYAGVAADEPDEPVPAMAEGPVQAIADMTPAGEEKFRGMLGSKCNMERLYVFVLGHSDAGYDVINAPNSDCEMTRFVISPDDASVRPEDPLRIP